YAAYQAPATGGRGGGEDDHQAGVSARALHLSRSLRRDSGTGADSDLRGAWRIRRVIGTARNETRRVALADRVLFANRWWLRLRGLLFRPPLGPGDGMLLVPCRAVHMAGMRYPIDVVFVGPHGRVVAVYPGLAPG